MRWAEIKIAVSEDAADIVSNILIEEGCGGVAVTGPSVRASGTMDVVVDSGTIPEETTVTCYLPVDDRLESRLENIRTRVRSLPDVGTDIGPGEITVKLVDDADWAGAWKSFFKPVEIGNVLIKPSWEDVEPQPNQIVVEIDPGMAFGTGNHPTTQLCVLALEKYLKGGEQVADVGTGSGILAITAARLGASEVVATEVDPVAVEAARKNVERNDVQDRVKVFQCETLDCIEREADLVVANITANVITMLAQDLTRITTPGGTLIASGIIEERADEVTQLLAGHGFGIVETMSDDGWVAVVLESRRREITKGAKGCNRKPVLFDADRPAHG